MLLTQKQKSKLETNLFNVKIKPFFTQIRPQNAFRSKIFDIVYVEDKLEPEKKKRFQKVIPGQAAAKPTVIEVTQVFDHFILFVIIINTLILFIKWPNMSPMVQRSVDIINYVCTGVFIIEAILKITAFGRGYFKDLWNIFDFIIVVGSLVFISPNFTRQKKTVTMLRAFRIARVFKLFKKLTHLKSIFTTIEYTLSAMINVGMLMLLIIYLFAIIGVYFFADIKINEPMS